MTEFTYTYGKSDYAHTQDLAAQIDRYFEFLFTGAKDYEPDPSPGRVFLTPRRGGHGIDVAEMRHVMGLDRRTEFTHDELRRLDERFRPRESI